jgi:hypothetical protein
MSKPSFSQSLLFLDFAKVVRHYLILQRECRAVLFGLNALIGRKRMPNGVMGGPWDSSNARDFIQYTVDHGYKINAWELGKLLFSTSLMYSCI